MSHRGWGTYWLAEEMPRTGKLGEAREGERDHEIRGKEETNADHQTIKSRLQSAPQGTYSGFLDCARKLIAADGVTALWKGFGPAMARAFPANVSDSFMLNLHSPIIR
jgi:hypothetical protein